MGNYTRTNLWLLSLVMFLMSFTTKEISTDPSLAAAKTSLTLDAYSFELPTVVNLKEISNKAFTQFFEHTHPTIIKSKPVKYKKYKRATTNSFSGINAPVKEIPALSFNIFWKDSYSKPHFLSHIHSFVFRLTPF